MVLQLLGPLIGAAGSIFSGILGSNAQQEANEMNYQVALLNYYQRERERRQSIQEAQRQEAEGKLGTTDIYGNRTRFIPGVGWVNELAPGMQGMRDLQLKRETEQLAQDIPARRAAIFRNIAAQRREGNIASAILDAMGRQHRESTSDVVNRRNLLSAKAINEGADKALGAAITHGVRTGSSNIKDIMEGADRGRSKSLEEAFARNYEGATSEAEERYGRNQSNEANLYNLFAQRASAVQDAPYNPRNIEGVAASALSGARGAGAQSSAALLNAFAKQGGVLDYRQDPNYNMSEAVASGTRFLGGMDFSGMGNRQNQGPQYASAQQPYYGYYPAAPGIPNDMYRGDVGLF